MKTASAAANAGTWRNNGKGKVISAPGAEVRIRRRCQSRRKERGRMNKQEKIEFIGELLVKTFFAVAAVIGFYFGLGGIAELICRLIGCGA